MFIDDLQTRDAVAIRYETVAAFRMIREEIGALGIDADPSEGALIRFLERPHFRRAIEGAALAQPGPNARLGNHATLTQLLWSTYRVPHPVRSRVLAFDQRLLLRHLGFQLG